MKGIAFSAEMAQAIYEGRKTMFREVIKFPDGFRPDRYRHGEVPIGFHLFSDDPYNDYRSIVPPYSIGERLFVQEPFKAWCVNDPSDWHCGKWMAIYKGDDSVQPEYLLDVGWADDDINPSDADADKPSDKWKSPVPCHNGQHGLS